MAKIPLISGFVLYLFAVRAGDLLPIEDEDPKKSHSCRVDVLRFL
jgi:hypothetical protein